MSKIFVMSLLALISVSTSQSAFGLGVIPWEEAHMYLVQDMSDPTLHPRNKEATIEFTIENAPKGSEKIEEPDFAKFLQEWEDFGETSNNFNSVAFKKEEGAHSIHIRKVKAKANYAPPFTVGEFVTHYTVRTKGTLVVDQPQSYQTTPRVYNPNKKYKVTHNACSTEVEIEVFNIKTNRQRQWRSYIDFGTRTFIVEIAPITGIRPKITIGRNEVDASHTIVSVHSIGEEPDCLNPQEVSESYKEQFLSALKSAINRIHVGPPPTVVKEK